MPPTTRRSKTSPSSSAQPQQQTLNFKATAAKVTKAGGHHAGIKQSLAGKKYDEVPVKSAIEVVVPLRKRVEEEKKVDDDEAAEASPASKYFSSQETREGTEVQEKVKQQDEKGVEDTTIIHLPISEVEVDLSRTIPSTFADLLTAEEKEASEITDAQIRQYYNEKILGARKTQPVHQAPLPLTEKILRHFDLSSQYGPCIGITRINRWKRAHNLNLNPPIEVLALCLQVKAEGGSSKVLGHGKAEEGETAGEGKKRDTRMAYVDEFLSTRTEKE